MGEVKEFSAMFTPETKQDPVGPFQVQKLLTKLGPTHPRSKADY